MGLKVGLIGVVALVCLNVFAQEQTQDQIDYTAYAVSHDVNHATGDVYFFHPYLLINSEAVPIGFKSSCRTNATLMTWIFGDDGFDDNYRTTCRPEDRELDEPGLGFCRRLGFRYGHRPDVKSYEATGRPVMRLVGIDNDGNPTAPNPLRRGDVFEMLDSVTCSNHRSR